MTLTGWSGLTAGQILYPSDATTLTSSANLVYTDSPTKLRVGTATVVSTATPAQLSLGGSYADSAGNRSKTKFRIFDDGAGVVYGFGISVSNFEYHANDDAAHSFYTSDLLRARLGPTDGEGWNIFAGTATTDVNALSVTQTWNATGVTFTAEETNVTATASALGSLLRDWQVGGASKFAIGKRGNTISTASANNRAAENPLLYGATTDAATAVELTTDGAAGSGTTNRILVPADTTLSCVVNIAVKQTASASGKQMLRQFVITNNGGTTAIQGTVVTLGTDSGTAGLATVTCTITANDTDDAVKIEVNGVLATNLRYTAYVVSTEVLYS